MDRVTEFTLTDVRCFAGEQRARLAPITLLVGENSTGKTTFLGCYSALRHWVGESTYAEPEVDFNREPFSMGSFRDIVRSSRDQQGSVETFTCGINVVTDKRAALRPHFFETSFSEQRSQLNASSIRYQVDNRNFFNIKLLDNDRCEFSVPGHNFVTNPLPHVVSDNNLVFWKSYLVNFGLSIMFFHSGSETQQIFPKSMEVIFDYVNAHLTNENHEDRFSPGFTTATLGGWAPKLPRPVPIAPLRSKPKRTYDPVRETASPEGDHVPMLMMRLDRTDKDEWKSLRDGVVDFGRKAGMFSDIAVRRHGRDMGDPFQLRVKARSGTPANLVDVGYGVSQSLPIVVDVYREKGRTFLLQQPEVHLHPRAQAELASLFVESFKKNGNEFMIETHSDQIVDRVRILVGKGEIAPDDVSILYFEPKRNAVQIHSLTLDEHGNLENAPPGYRDFFLKETDRLLGFDE